MLCPESVIACVTPSGMLHVVAGENALAVYACACTVAHGHTQSTWCYQYQFTVTHMHSCQAIKCMRLQSLGVP